MAGLKLGFPGFLREFNLTGRRAFLICLFFGFFVRLVPELLAFPLPIGTDTVYYAFVMKNGVVWADWSSFFTSTWLLYALVVPLYGVLQVDPFLLLKFVAPLLFGFNVAGVYWFSRRMLGWDLRWSVLAGVFFALQLASLRISWDLLRNTLGMSLLLFALPFLGKVESKRNLALFALLSVLTVFAHEFSCVALVVVVLGVVGWRFVRRRFGRAEGLTVLAFLPALVFATGMFLGFFHVNSGVSTATFSTGEASVGRSLFFANYLTTADDVFNYASYGDLLVDVTLLFAVLYLSYLFLVWKGYFRNGVLNILTGLLLVGAFGCLVWPFFALDLWSRWMFMLVYPFTFYAVNGLLRLLRGSNGVKGKFDRFRRKAVLAALGVTVVLGSVYLATPVLMNTVQVGVYALPKVPAHFSSAPAVPYQDVEGVVDAWTWLDENMESNSCVLVNNVFVSWRSLYLDKSHVTIDFWNNVSLALDDALEWGFGSVYLVWWNTDIGWYDVSIPGEFVGLRDFGRISVYKFSL